MALTWTPGKITKRQVWCEGLFTLSVEAPDVAPFQPGQFLQLGLQRGAKHVHRPYSVASPHGRILEFYIVLVEEGELTPLLWDLHEGDSLDVSEKAAGRFTLEHAPQSDNLWLVATGTGLAPYIAMLRTPEPWQNYRQICVVHGVRNGDDLTYQEELGQYAQRYPGRFSYVPVASRDDSAAGLHGRIPPLYESGELEAFAKTPLSAAESTIFLCGNPAMLDDMEQTLGKRDFQRHRSRSPGQIIVERYW